MHDYKSENIFDDDDVVDFMIYDECEKRDRGQKGGKGGCLGIFVLMLLPAASMMFLSWKY